MSVQPIPSGPKAEETPRTARRLPLPGGPVGGIRKRWLFLGVALAVLAVGAVVATRGGKPVPGAGAPNADTGMTVTTAPVVQVEAPRTLMVTGSLAAWDELPIGTATSGIAVVEVLVDEGDRVQAGQLLARFDDSVLKADLLQKEATLREAEAVAAEAQANVRRAEELGRSGTVSQRELESRRATAATAQARVGVAQANREQSLARLRQTEIKAPTAGTIVKRNARLGAVMSAGGVELFRLIRDDRVELVAEVPERDLAGIVAGQPVALALDGGAGPEREGRVRLVSPTVDPKTRIGTVKVDVPAAPDLRPGMFLIGRIRTGTTVGPAVPETAIVYKDAKPLLFVLGGDGKVQMRPVQTGTRAAGQVTIAAGASVGETVVVAGAGYLKDGDPVVVADAQAATPVKPLPKQN